MNDGPAVILSSLDDVDFVAATWTIKSTRPVLSLKHQIRPRLPVHSLRVAMTKRPDLRSRVLLSDKGIVLRHRAIVVQPQRLAGKRVEFLCEIALRRVAGSHVQFSIRSKANAAAGVKLCRRQVFDYHFTIDETFGSFPVTHDTNTHTAARIRIREIDKVIAAELRMKRDAHQTAFALLLDIRHDKQRLRI